MRAVFVVILLSLLSACASSPSIHRDFIDKHYSVVLFPEIEGDTANYVNKRFSNNFTDNTELRLISFDTINASMKTLGIQTEQHKLSVSQLQSIADIHGAQGILYGKVKSGARAISSSINIDSSIRLDLIDVQTAQVVASENVEQTMTMRERRNLLREVSDDIIERYKKVFASLNKG